MWKLQQPGGLYIQVVFKVGVNQYQHDRLYMYLVYHGT